jgi:hypothetical protein
MAKPGNIYAPAAASTPNSNKTTLSDSILSDRNGGLTDQGIGKGQTLIVPFGLDRSALANPASSERNGARALGGGIDNLSHSIKGASMANEDKGRKDRT